MAVSRSDFMSNVWREGIFGKILPAATQVPKPCRLMLTKHLCAVQRTGLCLSPEELAQSAAFRPRLWSIWGPTPASLAAMSTRRSVLQRRLPLCARVQRSLALVRLMFAAYVSLVKPKLLSLTQRLELMRFLQFDSLKNAVGRCVKELGQIDFVMFVIYLSSHSLSIYADHLHTHTAPAQQATSLCLWLVSRPMASNPL